MGSNTKRNCINFPLIGTCCEAIGESIFVLPIRRDKWTKVSQSSYASQSIRTVAAQFHNIQRNFCLYQFGCLRQNFIKRHRDIVDLNVVQFFKSLQSLINIIARCRFSGSPVRKIKATLQHVCATSLEEISRDAERKSQHEGSFDDISTAKPFFCDGRYYCFVSH